MTTIRPTSSLRAGILLAALAASTLPACQKTNSGFCGDSCTDAAVDGPTGCIANPDVCSMTQTCDRADDMCVDCTPGDNKEDTMECTAAAPVCDTTRACRECRADSECTASQFCEGGQCIATDNVVYVDTAGTDNPTCDINAKCKSPNVALSKVTPTRKYMRFEPSAAAYQLSATFQVATGALVVHGAGAELRRGNGLMIEVKDGADVIIDGLAIRNAAGGAGSAVKCSANSKVTLRHTILSSMAQYGVDASTCVVQITRSEISGAAEGGVKIADGRFEITNSFIFLNGKSAASVGGLFLSPNATPNILDSNTIVANTADNGATNAGGVLCDGATPIIARNNVIHSSVRAVREVIGTNCTHTFSVIGTDGAPAGNMSLPAADLGLKNLTTGMTNDDFHINPNATPASMLKGAGDPSMPLTVDFDGDRRPNPAGGPDIGADEVP